MDKQEFLEKAKEVYKPASYARIVKAFEYAEERHKDQYRLSGEPYIAHPVAVAAFLMDLGID